MIELEDILKFVRLINEFQAVKRRIFISTESRYENDVEHSYQLGILGWYIVVANKLDLDPTAVLKYGLVHDLVEVYAGDTYAFEPDQAILNSKAEREAAAAQRLEAEFPDFPELYELIHDYETHSNPESRFVYALDKIVPMMNVYLDNGKTWQMEHVTLDMLVNNKADKIARSPEVKIYFDDLVEILSQKEFELFGTKTYEKK